MSTVREIAERAMTDFESWWASDGRFIDPDTIDVDWFDKRKELAALAFVEARKPAPLSEMGQRAIGKSRERLAHVLASTEPMLVRCAFCGGTGGTEFGHQVCSWCHGEGLVEASTEPRGDEDWPRLNRERGELITKSIDYALSDEERSRLQYLTGYADAHIASFRPAQEHPDTNTPLRIHIALKLMRAWNSGTDGFDSSVVMTVNRWIDGGMKGPVPWPNSPFFADWAKRKGYSNIDGFVGFRFAARTALEAKPTPPPANRCPKCGSDSVHQPPCVVPLAFSARKTPEARR